MTNNSVLRLFLILSILIIFIGILVIIFVPFDSVYVLDDSKSESINQQKNLLGHFYKTQQEEHDNIESPKDATKTHKDADNNLADIISAQETRSQQAGIASSALIQDQNQALDQIRDNNSIWQQRQARSRYQNDYQMLMLRNNPWSPHYRPQNQ